jgi:hypothetical protein
VLAAYHRDAECGGKIGIRQNRRGIARREHLAVAQQN